MPYGPHSIPQGERELQVSLFQALVLLLFSTADKVVVYLYVSHPMYCMPLCLFLDVCTCVLCVPVYIMYCAC